MTCPSSDMPHNPGGLCWCICRQRKLTSAAAIHATTPATSGRSGARHKRAGRADSGPSAAGLANLALKGADAAHSAAAEPRGEAGSIH
jgi:hypothetical protein